MKVRIMVEEKVRYTSEVIVEQPETIDDADFDALISAVENRCSRDSFNDFVYELEHRCKLKVHKSVSSYPNSPDGSELEIIDVSNVKDGE